MRDHVVFLLHGIRTQGEWAQRTAAILESDANIRVRPLRYEFLDILRFLVPWRVIRDRPVRRIAGLFRDEGIKGATRISVVAHSFGTYIIAKLLETELDISLYRVVLCGSIIPDDFEWTRFRHRLDSSSDWQVVNDCGMNDIWPVMAKSVTWGYGSSGRFGFGHGRVKDRFFPMSHSGFFGERHVRDYWLPYLADGKVVEGTLERATTPWWVSVLTVFKIRHVLLVLLAALAAWAIYALRPDVPSRLGPEAAVTPAPTTTSSSSLPSVGALALSPTPIPATAQLSWLNVGVDRAYVEQNLGSPRRTIPCREEYSHDDSSPLVAEKLMVYILPNDVAMVTIIYDAISTVETYAVVALSDEWAPPPIGQKLADVDADHYMFNYSSKFWRYVAMGTHGTWREQYDDYYAVLDPSGHLEASPSIEWDEMDQEALRQLPEYTSFRRSATINAYGRTRPRWDEEHRFYCVEMDGPIPHDLELQS